MIKKKIILILSIISLSILSIFLILKVTFEKNVFGIQSKIYLKYPNLKKEFTQNLFSKNSVIENLKNDYNFKFLPETQFVSLDLYSKTLIFSEKFEKNHSKKKELGGYKNRYKSFYIDQNEDNIFITDYLGGTYTFKKKKLDKHSKKENIVLTPIINNLKTTRVLDTLIHNQILYVSYIGGDDNCNKMTIAKSKLDQLPSNLNFQNIFQSSECGSYIQAGRMVMNKKDKDNTLLFSTSDQFPDNLINKPQEDDSIFGKILALNLIDNSFTIYSKGHRNIQGLFSNNEVIIATEHGPKGGDEINNILKGTNYGWPVASYGEKYGSSSDDEENFYLKDHESNGFKEPIYAFIPSIGISEIIKLSNNFSKKFENNFILTSLYGRNIFRIKFDKSFNKILFFEKIYIGQRIRDIKYIDSLSILVFAFEENGDIGIIKINE